MLFADRDPSLEPLIDQVLALVLTARTAKPAPGTPRRLDALFRALAAAGSPFAAEEAQELIWAIWCDHADAAAGAMMHEGIALMAAEEFDAALAVFDALVIAQPEWAEAWNKRATVLFIRQRDAESLADIARVLQREPRHFGAISGYGQIALRNGFTHEAAAAFQAVLALNPNLQGVESVLRELERAHAGTLN